MNSSSPKRAPHFVLFIATACGFGYIPLAPSTFGSLAGVALALPVYQFLAAHSMSDFQIIIIRGTHVDPLLVIQSQITFVVALAGLWSADSASRHWQQKGPQRVVIDEVSGQHLALLLGSALPIWWRTTNSWAPPWLGFITNQSALGWKYLLLGFIFSRVFDS